MDKEQMNRRQFLGVATWAISGLIGLAYAIPGIAYLIGPALRRIQERNWIPLAPVSKVELDTPTLFKARIERQTGWIVNEEELSVYIITTDGRQFKALSNICTHLGCRVRWIADQQQFFCPCHNAIFDKDGAVVAGPPPRPLDQYETRVEDEQILILAG